MVKRHDDVFTSPFWRPNGAFLIIIKSLNEMVKILNLMIKEGPIVAQKLIQHSVKYPHTYPHSWKGTPSDKEELEEYSKIVERFWDLEDNLKYSATTANLMAAIDLEGAVNKFCFFNLGEVTTNAIDRLQLSNKLEVIHKVLGLPDFKGTKPYEAVQALVDWRNAFAHGKCPDMPIHSIKKNHFTWPEEETDSSDIVHETLGLLHHYSVACEHLLKISKDYNTSSNFALCQIEPLLSKLQTFRFVDNLIIEKGKVQTKTRARLK